MGKNPRGFFSPWGNLKIIEIALKTSKTITDCSNNLFHAVSRFTETDQNGPERTETDFREYQNGLSEYRNGLSRYRNGPERIETDFVDTETDSLSTETDSLGTETDRNGLL